MTTPSKSCACGREIPPAMLRAGWTVCRHCWRAKHDEHQEELASHPLAGTRKHPRLWHGDRCTMKCGGTDGWCGTTFTWIWCQKCYEWRAAAGVCACCGAAFLGAYRAWGAEQVGPPTHGTIIMYVGDHPFARVWCERCRTSIYVVSLQQTTCRQCHIPFNGDEVPTPGEDTTNG
jgi:hypothetical protein